MHSTIILFSEKKDSKNTIKSSDIDEVVPINICADYIGNKYTTEDVTDPLGHLLESMFPHFIHYENGEIKVDETSKEDYGYWFEEHLIRVRDFQDTRIKQSYPGMYAYYASMFKNVITEGKNSYDCDIIFAIKHDADDEHGYGEYISYYSYIDFIEHISLYSGYKHLYLIGGADYHF